MFSKKSRRTTYKMNMTDTVTQNVVKTENAIMNFNKESKIQPQKSIDVFSRKNLTRSYRNNEGMVWGPPVWTFLHTIVEKIKEEHFNIIRTNLLKHIYTICTNLPCPDCSQHAKTYLTKINFNTLNSKEKLKAMIFDFHNDVNSRKSKPLFQRINLDEQYKNQVLTTVFYNFVIKFKDKSASNRFIHEDMYRSSLTKNISGWFNANQEYFYE